MQKKGREEKKELWIRGKKGMKAGNERRKEKGRISSAEEKTEYNDFGRLIKDRYG